MKDDELEQLLRRVRPVGPSPDLRARIVGVRRQRPAWPWAMAAAALLVTVVALQWSASELRGQIRPVAGAGAAPDSETAVLREIFGLKEDEIRAMRLKRDFDRIMAAESPQGQAPQ